MAGKRSVINVKRNETGRLLFAAYGNKKKTMCSEIIIPKSIAQDVRRTRSRFKIQKFILL